ncbi:hypothetical protein [Halochromatium sp.]
MSDGHSDFILRLHPAALRDSMAVVALIAADPTIEFSVAVRESKNLEHFA